MTQLNYILDNLKVKQVCLMTNNPFKIDSLKYLGIKVVSIKSIIIKSNKYNKKYLKTKSKLMGHYNLNY
jgi:GTP cyclohydrolase II